MADETVLYKLKEILSRELGIPMENVTEESLLADDLGADSLDTAELAMVIQDEFNYDLNENDMKKIKSVRDLYEIVRAGMPSTKK